MVFPRLLTGASLPPKTLSLTYDDGPGVPEPSGAGPHTLAIARFLHSEKIGATFFMFAPHVARHPGLVRAVRRLGHLAGSHSRDHRPYTVFDDHAELLSDFRSAERGLRGEETGVLPVRPPYGAWSPPLATVLNADLLCSAGVLGPVGWDISTEDWTFWRDDRTAEECAEIALQEILAADRGIVLMHDSSADLPAVRMKNRTYELTRLLIPQLRKRGFSFVRLDGIPLLHDLWGMPVVCALRSASGRYLAVQPDGRLRASAGDTAAAERLHVEMRGSGTVALRALGGFLATVPGSSGNAVRLVQDGSGDECVFSVVTFRSGEFLLRSAALTFLECTADGMLTGGTVSPSLERGVFGFANLTSLPDLWQDPASP
jgi:peptidoglycan/xylan/chitin deacetylase (PgdA/CDA1 family)